LEHTTRHVSPTFDDEVYRRRCRSLIADLEDAEAAFGGAKPKRSRKTKTRECGPLSSLGCADARLHQIRRAARPSQ
jgi:DNA-binding transcriptional LysR family regulator